jgi:ABC-type dipeptide/oligopeptide/nickel transport system ATPase component
MPVKVHLDQVGMAFTTPGGTFRAVAPMSLSIESGRFVSLVGRPAAAKARCSMSSPACCNRPKAAC